MPVLRAILVLDDVLSLNAEMFGSSQQMAALEYTSRKPDSAAVAR